MTDVFGKKDFSGILHRWSTSENSEMYFSKVSIDAVLLSFISFFITYSQDRKGTSLKDNAIDAHLVAGVLTLTLKDMQQSIFVGVYNDILESSMSITSVSRLSRFSLFEL